MAYLLWGLLLLAVVLLVPAFFSQFRGWAIQLIGVGPYIALNAGLSTAALVLIAWGYHLVSNGAAAGDFAYIPARGMRHATMSLVLIAFIFLGACFSKGILRRFVRYPLDWALILWSAGHLLSNGRVYDVYLFGSLLLIGILLLAAHFMQRKAWPREARITGDLIAVAVGLILYAVFLFWFHPVILKLPVLS